MSTLPLLLLSQSVRLMEHLVQSVPRGLPAADSTDNASVVTLLFATLAALELAYRGYLARLLACYPDTAVLQIRALVSRHHELDRVLARARSDQLRMELFAKWLMATAPTYAAYVAVFRVDPDVLLQERLLRLMPLTKIRFFAKFTQLLVQQADPPHTDMESACRAIELQLELARAKLASEEHNADTNHFQFDRVVEFRSRLPCAGVFDKANVTPLRGSCHMELANERTRCELILLAPSPLDTPTAFAIVTVDNPGRSLAFPVFRPREVEADVRGCALTLTAASLPASTATLWFSSEEEAIEWCHNVRRVLQPMLPSFGSTDHSLNGLAFAAEPVFTAATPRASVSSCASLITPGSRLSRSSLKSGLGHSANVTAPLTPKQAARHRRLKLLQSGAMEGDLTLLATPSHAATFGPDSAQYTNGLYLSDGAQYTHEADISGYVPLLDLEPVSVWLSITRASSNAPVPLAVLRPVMTAVLPLSAYNAVPEPDQIKAAPPAPVPTPAPAPVSAPAVAQRLVPARDLLGFGRRYTPSFAPPMPAPPTLKKKGSFLGLFRRRGSSASLSAPAVVHRSPPRSALGTPTKTDDFASPRPAITPDVSPVKVADDLLNLPAHEEIPLPPPSLPSASDVHSQLSRAGSTGRSTLHGLPLRSGSTTRKSLQGLLPTPVGLFSLRNLLAVLVVRTPLHARSNASSATLTGPPEPELPMYQTANNLLLLVFAKLMFGPRNVVSDELVAALASATTAWQGRGRICMWKYLRWETAGRDHPVLVRIAVDETCGWLCGMDGETCLVAVRLTNETVTKKSALDVEVRVGREVYLLRCGALSVAPLAEAVDMARSDMRRVMYLDGNMRPLVTFDTLSLQSSTGFSLRLLVLATSRASSPRQMKPLTLRASPLPTRAAHLPTRAVHLPLSGTPLPTRATHLPDGHQAYKVTLFRQKLTLVASQLTPAECHVVDLGVMVALDQDGHKHVSMGSVDCAVRQVERCSERGVAFEAPGGERYLAECRSMADADALQGMLE